LGSGARTLGVIARLDRAIQYAETVVVEPGGRGVLDAPVEPGHDSSVRRHGWHLTARGHARTAL